MNAIETRPTRIERSVEDISVEVWQELDWPGEAITAMDWGRQSEARIS